MSESEKIRRERYQKNRKMKILSLSIVCGVFALILLVSTLMLWYSKKTSYVPYKDKGSVVYHAYLADNEFYDQESLNGTHAYVASLIRYMTSDFHYEMKMDTRVRYRYSYSIDATLEIRDKKTGMVIYNPVENLLPMSYKTSESKSLVIDEHVEFDYNRFNSRARSFLQTYGLTDVSGNLLISMCVDIKGESNDFKQDIDDKYTISVSIPLLQSTVAPSVTSTIPTSVRRIQVRDTGIQRILTSTCIGSAVSTVILLAALYFFIISTRDKHLDYSHKVNRLLSAYRSYIQKVNKDYSPDGVQTFRVSDFCELLEIRDTLQIPILMYENEDKTYSKFFVVNGNILYYYDISVKED